MRGATGIHLGRTTLTAVAVGGTAKHPKLLGVASVARPDGDAATVGKAVRALLVANGFPRDPVVAAIPNGAALLRSLALPFTNPEQIRRVLKGEAESALAGLSVDDVVVGAHLLGEVEGRGRVLAVAVRKTALTAELALLAAGGLDPLQVDLEGFCLANALLVAGECPEAGVTVCVDCEPGEIRLAVLADGKVREVRSVRFPLVEPPAAPATAPSDGAPAGDATAATVTLPAEGDAGLAALVGGPAGVSDAGLAEFRAELTRTLLSAGLSAPPARTCLTGTLATDPRLAAVLAELTGVAPVVVDPVARLRGDAPDAPAVPTVPGAAIALGAALKGIGLDRDEVNLRLDEFAFRRAFDQVSGRMATLVTLAFLAAVVWVYDLRVRQQAAEKQHVKTILEPAATRFREVWPGTEAEKKAKVAALDRPGARPELLQTFTKAMDAQVVELTGGKTRKRDPNQRSAFDIWREWTDSLKGVTPKHWIVDKFRIEPGHQSYQVFCEGWLDLEGGRGSLDQMLRAMRAHPMFTDTTPGETKPMTPPGGSEERLKFALSTKTPDTLAAGGAK